MTLQKKLEAAFQEGIHSGQFDLLARVLRTYAIIDKIRDAELLFREVVVKPYMNEVICCLKLANLSCGLFLKGPNSFMGQWPL